MPSEAHKSLYQRLSAIKNWITTALDEDDTLALMDLATKNRSAMDQLRQAGLSQEIGLLRQVEDMRDEVHEVLEMMTQQRDELCRQLVMFEKKKKVSAAYVGNSVLLKQDKRY